MRVAGSVSNVPARVRCEYMGSGDAVNNFESSSKALPDRYWATLDVEELAPELRDRANEYARFVLTTGRADRWRRNYCLMYGLDPDSARMSSRTTIGGSQGELIELRANALRSLAEAQHTLVCGSRPGWAASVSSLDSSATDSIPLVDAVLDHALIRRSAEPAANQVAMNALIFAEGWGSVRWDEQDGPATGIMGGDVDELGDAPPDQAVRVTYLGDVLVLPHRPDCVVRDVGLDSNTPNDWIILVSQQNRWTLAELYPDHAEVITQGNARTELDDLRDQIFMGSTDSSLRLSRDQVWVYEFFHRSTPALPNGRYSLLVNDMIVADGENKYGDIPVYPMIPDVEPGAPFGYSSNYDLMALQQAFDAAVTSFVSMTENLGQPGLWGGPNNAGIGVDVIGGFNFINSPNKPEPVPYLDPSSVQIVVSAMKELAAMMTRLSGLPPTALGDVPSGASGDALAMMHALAVQSTSKMQAAYGKFFASAMFGVIRRYRTFATTERLVAVVGKGNKKRARRWTGADLAAIDAINVEMRAAVTRTATGRQQLADKWLMQGLIATPQQYMEVATTGSLTPLTDKPLSERALIERENEMMVDGQPARIAATHNHPAHINEHSVLLLDPDVLNDPVAYETVSQHLIEHVQTWQQISIAQPDLLAALGIPPAPSSAMMMMGGAPADPNANPAGDPNAPKPTPEPSPPNQPAKLEEANVPPGGGMDAGAGAGDLTGGGRLPAGTGNPVMA